IYDNVGRPDHVERDEEKAKERAQSEREQRKDSEQARREIPVGGKRPEAIRQARPDHSWKDEDKPKEAKAVQRRDCPLRIVRIHPLEPRPDVSAKAEQPRNIAKNQMGIEDHCWRHVSLRGRWRTPAQGFATSKR